VLARTKKRQRVYGPASGSLTSGFAAGTLGLRYAFPLIAGVLLVSAIASVALIRTPARRTGQPVAADAVAGFERQARRVPACPVV
jgi:hypothetical protein